MGHLGESSFSNGGPPAKVNDPMHKGGLVVTAASCVGNTMSRRPTTAIPSRCLRRVWGRAGPRSFSMSPWLALLCGLSALSTSRYISDRWRTPSYWLRWAERSLRAPVIAARLLLSMRVGHSRLPQQALIYRHCNPALRQLASRRKELGQV